MSLVVGLRSLDLVNYTLGFSVCGDEYIISFASLFELLRRLGDILHLFHEFGE